MEINRNKVDISRPVKYLKPFAGEEQLIYQITSYDPESGKCILQLFDDPTGINPDTVPPESASINDLVNI